MASSLLLLALLTEQATASLLATAGAHRRASSLPSPRCYMGLHSSGNYEVSTGAWPPPPPPLASPPPHAATPARDKRAPPGKHAARGRPAKRPDRSAKEDAVLGSPVVRRVLQRAIKLSPSAGFEEVEALLEGKKMSARDYSTVLRELRVAGKPSVALHVGKWLEARPGPLPNEKHYLTMLHACAAAQLPGPALELLSTLESRPAPLPLATRVRAITHVISAHVRSGAPQPVLSLLDRLDDLAATGVALSNLTFGYVAAIRAFDHTGEWAAALEVYERARRLGVPLDAHGYAAALGACRTGKQAQTALEVMAQLRADEALAPNSIMFNLAMGACCRAGEWEAALTLFDERRALSETGALTADAFCYGTAINACAQGKQWERALELLDDMNDETDLVGDPTFAWNNALVACNRAKEWEKALTVYERMRQRVREAALTETEHSVAGAIQACGGLGDWERAQAIFDGSKQRTTMCYNALLAALVGAQQCQLALSYFDALKDGARGCRPNSQSYELAIEACGSVDTDRALVLWDEMQVL
ncbi:hypothetical protein AB1Y20_013142 [Prymnesium parvum]|uniref:Pentacotripeptide-repeat region of PRORP domain-containing protein n=1 Tax=Prymnesium parvum TaxID=97485 RepID=A0AB34IKP8_PRYPA